MNTTPTTTPAAGESAANANGIVAQLLETADLSADNVAYLRRPFEEAKWLPQGRVNENSKGTKALAYIDSSIVVERLSDVDPGWTATYHRLGATVDEWKGLNYATECTVTVKGVPRTDIGYAAGGIEPLKAAYSDALKRAALRHGVGSYLRDASWSIFLPRQVKDANGKTHDAFTLYQSGNGKWNMQMQPAGRAYLRAEYRKILAQPGFEKHYGKPVEYGSVDDVLDQSVPDDGEPAPTPDDERMTDAEVETLVLLASYTGRKTGADANRRKFQQPGMVFERQLVQLLPQVQAHLELSADGVTAVREWANDAASGEPGMFDALSEGLTAAQGAKA